MKKRWIAVLLCAALLAAFGWGQPRISGEGETYDLYFLEADLSDAPGGDALRAEPLYIESGEVRDTRELAEYLVTELLAGPEDAALTSAIPEETTLLSLELDGTRAKVDLSSRYRLLSGVALALADYAITLTLTQLPEISAVSVTVRGQPLAYRDRQIFTARDVLFSSNEDVIDTLNATLYFLDETGGLTPVEMTLDLYEGDTQAGAVVKALLEGTEEKDWLSAIPEGFQVTSVRLEESTCYVDLPTAALPGLPEGRICPPSGHWRTPCCPCGQWKRCGIWWTVSSPPPTAAPLCWSLISAQLDGAGRRPIRRRRTAAPRRRRPETPSGPRPGLPGPCAGCG
ncbi:MAG: GerMN domain-containing protein [Dysosmobacter welbionis]